MSSPPTSHTGLRRCRAALVTSFASFSALLALPVYAGMAGAEPLSATARDQGGALLGVLLPGAVFLLVAMASAGPGRRPRPAALGPRFCPICGSPRDIGEAGC